MLTPKDKLKIVKGRLKEAFTIEPKEERQKNREEKQKGKVLQKEHKAYLKSIDEEFGLEKKKKGGNWIKGAIKKPGALRASLGVKKDEKIPKGKLAAAAKKGGKLGQRARLAITLGKMKKNK
jgi:hypothetical protein